MRRSVCLFAGLLCVAAALHCSPVAAQEQSVSAVEPIPAQTMFAYHNALCLRHTNTYDLPREENAWGEAAKVFVVQILTEGSGAYYSDIVLDTNVGMGVLRTPLGNSEATRWNYIEILCYPDVGDDCSPDKLVIYNASAAPDRYRGNSHERGDIMHKLYRIEDTYLPIATTHGELVPASLSKLPKEKQIQVAYEGSYWSHGGNVALRLTFPPGQLQRYAQVHLFSDEWTDFPKEVPKRNQPPDSLQLYLDEPIRFSGEYDPARPEHLRDKDFSVGFIREAYAWEKGKKGKKGKKINILPYLVEDTFRMLPIHGPNGLLPFGEPYNYSLGSE